MPVVVRVPGSLGAAHRWLTGNANGRHSSPGDDRLMTAVNTAYRSGADGTPPADPSGVPAKTELRRADGQPVRVLVVDDESTLTELLSMALRYEGWEVQSAGDGLTAVRV